MNKSNRRIRILLARIFGDVCMFKSSNAEEFIEKLGIIKTYKQFKKETHYKSKKIRKLESIKTFHHFQHISENGETTEENGAIINILAHRYLHSLPREQEEIINDYIREWKKRNYKECGIIFIEQLEKPFEIDLAEVELEKELIIKPFNRAKNKRETKKAYEEYLDELGG